MLNLDRKTREIFHDRCWNRIEDDRERVLAAIKGSHTLSIVRCGDGEIKALEGNHPLASHLIGSIKNCDLIGVPDNFYFNYRKHERDWDTRLLFVLNDKYHINLDSKRMISAVEFLFIPSLVGEICQNKRVLWISSLASRITENLKDPDFRDCYNLHNITSSQAFDVASGDGPLPARHHYQIVMDYFEDKIHNFKDYDIAIVGAGVLGKIYCNIIKTIYNKMAVDVGCLMSAYSGLRNRVAFKKGEMFDYLVWD